MKSPHLRAKIPLRETFCTYTEKRHGYGLIKNVEGRTGGKLDLEAGTLYAANHRPPLDAWRIPRHRSPVQETRFGVG